MRPTSQESHAVHITLWTRILMMLVAGCLSVAGSRAGAAPFLYVGNYAGEVQIVDTATNAVVGSIPTSNGSGIVLNPDGSRLYVADASSTVKVYDTSSNALLATIPGPVGGIAINSSGTRLYISSYFDSSVRVVDTSSYTDVATIPSPQATTLAVSPDGTRVYVTDQNTRVYVLDATTNTPLTYVTVGNFVTGLAVHPSGAFLYAANTNDDTVSVVDTATNSVVATVPVGPPGCCYFGPGGITVHPAGTFVYTVTADMKLHVIRTADNVLVASIQTPPNAPGADGTTFLKTSADGSMLYISKYSGGTVTAVATSTNAVTAIIPIPGVPGMLAMPNPDVDGDGVENAIDTGAGSFSDSNSPTPTTGHIVNANGLAVTVKDSDDPSEGVVITVGAGVGAARVSVCGFSLQVSAGSTIVATCGSITLKVDEGLARILLNAAETSYVEVSQDAVAKVQVQATDGTFAIDNLGDTPISVATDNVVAPVAPREHASAGTLFTGFSSPIEMNNVQNRVKAGSTVPLKWRLTNATDGSPVTNLSSASATVANLTCGLDVTDDLIEEASSGGAGLQNLGNGYYQFNWKTPKSYANSCKTLTLTLGGGVVPAQSALFSFVK